MGKRNKVTTRDIAEKLGISQSTVSMILSNKPNVSFTKETIDMVKETAREMEYRKPIPKESHQEKALANTIAILCPMVTNGYYSMMIQSITEQARKYDYTVMTAITFRDAANEEIYLDILSKTRLAGVIFFIPRRKFKKLMVYPNECLLYP